MSAGLYFAETWTYRTAYVIERSNVRRNVELTKAQQAYAQDLGSMSTTLTAFTHTVQGNWTTLLNILLQMVKSLIKMANLGLPPSCLPHQ